MRQAVIFLSTIIVLASCKPSGKIADSPRVSPAAPDGMKYIPETIYLRGNDRALGTKNHFAEEKPVHKVKVSAFFIDETEVTNAQFKAFTDATNYKTQAERGWERSDFPTASEEMLKPGAVIFTPTQDAVDPFKASPWTWWKFTEGASWRQPLGKGSSIEDRMQHPVVCVTYEDAKAYADWAGKRLPTEAEWEAAARGGMEQKIFTWGDDVPQEGKWMANTFHGTFPQNDKGLDGFAGSAPVKSYPANSYGLYDMGGNVWEICSDFFSPNIYQDLAKNPLTENPKGPAQGISQLELDDFLQSGTMPATDPQNHPLTFLRSVRGGSFLCHHTYCLRYRPAARHHTESLAPSNHTGFRCAKDIPAPSL